MYAASAYISREPVRGEFGCIGLLQMAGVAVLLVGLSCWQAVVQSLT